MEEEEWLTTTVAIYLTYYIHTTNSVSPTNLIEAFSSKNQTLLFTSAGVSQTYSIIHVFLKSNLLH